MSICGEDVPSHSRCLRTPSVGAGSTGVDAGSTGEGADETGEDR